MMRCLALVLCVAGLAAAEHAIFALRSIQQGSIQQGVDPVAAAQAAGADLARQAAAQGRTLRIVLFQETFPTSTPADGKRLGDALQAAVGAPTWGTGGSTPGYITNAEPAALPGGSLVAIGIGGDGLRVTAIADGGMVAHDYDKDPAQAAAVGALRQAAWTRGRDLARRLPRPTGPACAVLFGALHNDWHVPYAHGIHDGLPAGLPQVYGVGQMRDYLYADGAALTDPAGAPTPTGRALLLIEGRLAIAQATRRLEVASLPEARALLAGAAVAVRRGLPADPALTFLFGTVGFTKGAGVTSTEVYREILDAALGPAPVLGGFLGGEGGLDVDGRLNIGGGRLALLSIAAE
jgi:hypothetical protein